MTEETTADRGAVGSPVQRTVRPLLAPRDWQAMALREAAELTGTPEGSARLAESTRYAALADEIERLRARILELEAVHEDASGAILQAVADERERCAEKVRNAASYGLCCSDSDALAELLLAVGA